ncbi:MAG TPA: 2Fe-2S iron-sulfur cluster-binding protein [Polyangiaceae bacterium]|nr:2Fe-2S iron-sulfur cluster-binding protein [Polyangiaceae bacterium]
MVDETLRDGLQSASACDPPIHRKIALLHAMVDIGVDAVSIGLPAAGPRAVRDAVALAREVSDARLPVRMTAAARTTAADVRAIADVSARAGQAIDVYSFIGSSPIRQYVEGWALSFLLERVAEASRVARAAGLPFCLVLEDTTRTPPAVLRQMFAAAVEAGAARICLCDTVGHVDPSGAAALVDFATGLLRELGAPEVELDWHGHNDRGLALGNALAAARAGASAVHATAGGVGERCGNTAMEHLVEQLAAAGVRRAPPAAALGAYRALAESALSGDLSMVAEPQEPLQLVINGDNVRTSVAPSRTLLELLRYDLDLTGTKQGCDKGDCGACTVLVDGEPVLACLTLALMCHGRQVTTVESLSGAPSLDGLLDAFDRRGAGQCGFCTPGMLMSAKALLARDKRPTRAAVRAAISGNLCRCTGYGAIVDAVMDEAARARGERASPMPSGEEHAPPPLPPYRERSS